MVEPRPAEASPAKASPAKARWLSSQWGRLSERRRLVIEAVAFVVAVFFLGWGADALARAGAEAILARNIASAAGVIELPTVEVRGFAFVPQVIRGAYNEVDVTTRGITSGPLRVDRVDSQLFDVRVPFHDVLVQDIRRVGVGRSIQDVLLLYTDLNAYFAATGRPLRLAVADDGDLKLTGSVDILGQRVQVNATVKLSVADETIRITPSKINIGGATLSTASRLLLGQRLMLSVPLGTLPFGHQLTDATVAPDGIRVRAAGTAIIVQP